MGIKRRAGSSGVFEPPTGDPSAQHGSLGVGADPNERREPWYAAIGQFLVTVGDDAADWRRALAMDIAEAGALATTTAIEHTVGMMVDQPDKPSTSPKLRWYQFSLRSLFMLMVAVALGMGLVVVPMQRAGAEGGGRGD